MSVEGVRLRPLTAEDSSLLWDWINTRELVVQSSAFCPVHASSHAEWFANVQKQHDCVIFGIRLAQSHSLIGTCQLHSIHPVHRIAELQIRIGTEEYRNKGYGTQALQLLLDFGFRDLNLNRVHLHVLDTNHAAQKLYTHFHFQLEGRLRSAAFIDGRYHDIILMGLLRDEYFRDQGTSDSTENK